MANFTGLARGRAAFLLRRAGWDVELDGLNGAPPINIILGEEAHVTVHTALRMLGLGTRSIKNVPTDEQGRMMASELARTIKGCSGPTIVCAQAGNINTGAFDPLEQIAAATREAGAWLHVDGAFGLWAAVSDSLKHLTAGAELADSWATDGHKWLNVPYDSGLIMCAHPEPHRAAMNVSASYLVPARCSSAIHVNGCRSCLDEEEASPFMPCSSIWAAAAFATWWSAAAPARGKWRICFGNIQALRF